MPRLTRLRDGAGDSGSLSMLIKVKPEKENDWYVIDKDDENKPIIEYGKPKIGYMIRVGSPYARTYEAQDYWTTTPIIEIIEETENYVKFKTASKNESIYEWRQ